MSTFQVFCLTGFGFILISHYKEYGIKHIKDDSYFSLVGMIGGFTNGYIVYLNFFLEFQDFYGVFY